MIRTAWIGVLAVWVLAAAWGQGGAKTWFEVASVKPAGSDRPTLPRLTLNGFEADAATLVSLISVAYQIGGPQISGGEAWVRTDRFTVRAKVASAASPSQVREMLKTMLEERFQLRARQEMKDVPAVALMVAKPPKQGYLTKVDGSDCKELGAVDDPCAKLSAGPAGVNGRKVTMDLLCKMLTAMLQRRVVDRTGLSGVYDVKLDFALAADPAASDGEKMQAGMANLIAGLQQQWGFKTEPVKWQDPVIIIESAAKPAEN